jgi:hypothetical protein
VKADIFIGSACLAHVRFKVGSGRSALIALTTAPGAFAKSQCTNY